MIINNHLTESVLDCLEVSSAKEIIFQVGLWQILRTKTKSDHSLCQKWSLVQLLVLFLLKPLELGLRSPCFSEHCCLPSSYKDNP